MSVLNVFSELFAHKCSMYFLETRVFSHIITAPISIWNQQPSHRPHSCLMCRIHRIQAGSATDVTCVPQTSCELEQFLCVPLYS